MIKSICVACILGATALSNSALSQTTTSPKPAELPKLLAGLELPPSYKFVPNERPGHHGETWASIAGPDGFNLACSIWPVAATGETPHSGNFVSDAKRLDDEHKQWYMERRINGERVHITLTTKDRLMVSFPKRGINLAGNIKGTAQLTDALLIAYSIPNSTKERTNSPGKETEGK